MNKLLETIARLRNEKPRELWIQQALVTEGNRVVPKWDVHATWSGKIAADEYDHGDIITHATEVTKPDRDTLLQMIEILIVGIKQTSKDDDAACADSACHKAIATAQELLSEEEE